MWTMTTQRSPFRLAAILAGVLALGCLAGPTALAWQPRPHAGAPGKQALEEARRHYRRALQLYEQEGDAEGALAELERAYDLAPSYKILFNLGQAARAAHEYATALRALQRYLGDGGGELAAARRTEVEDQIVVLQGFVGQVEVVSSAAGATVSVDDVTVGTTPLDQPLVLNGGRRTLRLTTRDGAAVSKALTVAGGDRLRVALDPPAAAAPAPVPAVVQLLAPPPPPVERRRLPYTWTAWVVTGALGVAAAITGGLALEAADDLKRAPFPNAASAGDVRALSSRVTNLSVSFDVLGAAAVAALGASLFVTLKKFEVPRPNQAALRLDLAVGARAVTVSGRF
jgi:hypothetical protein